MINPTRIVPVVPDVSFSAPHDRGPVVYATSPGRVGKYLAARDRTVALDVPRHGACLITGEACFGAPQRCFILHIKVGSR